MGMGGYSMQLAVGSWQKRTLYSYWNCQLLFADCQFPRN